jgi:aspartyl-tRNA synthetase
MLRTHNCGELTKNQIGSEIILCGWIDTRRDHGNLIFFDLRDRWGRTQLVIDSESDKKLHQEAEILRSEFVIAAKGVVRKRPEGTTNLKLSTGEIEIQVKGIEILNASETPPFELLDHLNVAEELRLKYRYLDMRRPSMLRRLEVRHQITQVVRDYFNQHQFVEIETPILTKSTPEGARDFLVPSRLSKGIFYALPQSPQLFKQLLMVAGVDRYFQLARCFRDEDFRADRQLEHTQIDVEMSFITPTDIMSLIEELVAKIFERVCKHKVELPLQVLSYDDAMNRFGSDKPDMRFGLELQDVTQILSGSELKIFKSVIQNKGVIKGFKVSGKEFSRSDFDQLTKKAQEAGAKGLAWFKVTDKGFESPIAKFVSDIERRQLIKLFELKVGDTLLLIADNWNTTCAVLGVLRGHLAELLKLIPRDQFKLLWVVNFPLFEWNENEKAVQPLHHPFTAPNTAEVSQLVNNPLKVHAQAYDLVLNGTEIGGGSIRIHSQDIQKQVFRVLGITDEEAKQNFGFLLDALKFGAPPHGGIALGLDRLCAILLGVESIRDVIAFPKTQRGNCLLTEAPSAVYPKQLKELSLQVDKS